MKKHAVLVVFLIVLVSIGTIVLLNLLGGSASRSVSKSHGQSPLEVTPAQTKNPPSAPEKPSPQRLKKDYYITVQYENPVKLASKLKTVVAELNGYVVSEDLEKSGEDVTYRITFRVPNTADNENRMEEFFEAYRIRSLHLETEDVTSQYDQIMAEIESLEAEKAKLMEFYNISKDVDDLITLENRISSINSRLNYLYLQKDYYEKVTDYITYHVTIESGERPAFKLETHFRERIYKAIEILVEVTEIMVAATVVLTPIALLGYGIKKAYDRFTSPGGE